VTRLTLHKEGVRYYISYQEDFFHPDVSILFLLPGVVKGPSCHVVLCLVTCHTGPCCDNSAATFQACKSPLAYCRLRKRVVCAPCTSSIRHMETSSGRLNYTRWESAGLFWELGYCPFPFCCPTYDFYLALVKILVRRTSPFKLLRLTVMKTNASVFQWM
jgi:hypothetical protein